MTKLDDLRWTMMMLSERERELIVALRAQPLQHEHVIRIEDDRWTWTMQHPIEERFDDSLLTCQVAEHVHYWLDRPGGPGPGDYVVDDSEWADHERLRLTATRDWPR